SLAVARGLRLGELLALRWTDVSIDTKAPSVRVTHTLERLSAKKAGDALRWRLSPVKSKSSRRSLALPPGLAEVLRRHRARQAEERLLVGPHWQDHGFLFTTGTGAPLDASNLRRAFRRILKRAKLRRVRLHDLRHGAATLLLAQGDNLKQVPPSWA